MKNKHIVCITLSGALAALAARVNSRLRNSLPLTDGSLRLEGLSAPVDVIFDTAGIPHIKAETDRDGMRALGYVTAQDRLVAMDIMRHVAKGTLSELLGLAGLEIDQFMRTLELSRLAREFYGNIDEESRRLSDAFAAGVNSYASRPKKDLPFEYMLLGGRPQPWKAEDSIALGIFISWMLDAFWPMDLMREKLIRALGQKLADKLLPEGSGTCEPTCLAEGRGCKAETLEPGEDIDWGFGRKQFGGRWLGFGLRPRVVSGSNNWVVNGSRSETGKPILASDPHIQHMAPSTLYLSHLKTPRFNVAGAGFIGVPLVVMGHNEQCAWAPTSLVSDMVDLYVEKFESETSNRYLYKGEWIEPEVTVEDVKVRLMGTRRLEIIKTVHGPIIMRKGDRGLALKWVGQDTQFDMLEPFIQVNTARDCEQLREAFRDCIGPALNFVFADMEGNIGYQAVAKVPLRAKGDGTIPYYSQDGDCEWEGYIPFDEMPTASNPASGWIATANNKIVSEEYEHLITKCWESPYRQARIVELLKSKDKFTLDDMREIHHDAFTYTGRTYAGAVAAAAKGRELEPDMKEAVDRLAAWDYQARAESTAMTIYFFGWHHLTDLLLRHRLGDELFEHYIYTYPNLRLAVEGILSDRDNYWLHAGYADFDEVILLSLRRSMDEVSGTYRTTDQGRWQWGAVHKLTAFSLLGVVWPLTTLFNVGPAPRDGEAETINNSLPESDPMTQVLARGAMGGSEKLLILPDRKSHAAYAGPVLRFLADLSDWDNSRIVLDVGQSGHRLSPHYKDHFEKWLKTEYYTLPFSDEAVERNAEGKLRLTP
jgi:penicillin amidase